MRASAAVSRWRLHKPAMLSSRWLWPFSSMLLATFLCGVMFQLLFAETRQGGALAESLQLKQWQWRTLELLKGDLERASSWQINPDAAEDWACAFANRQPKLAITPRDGSEPVVYSLGSAPSSIWRGDVLMRCGPPFGLQGEIRSGSRYQNRVVLDGVDHFKLYQPSGLPVLQMQLEQRTRRGGRVRSQGVG